MIIDTVHPDSARIDGVIDAKTGQRIFARQMQLLDTDTMRYEACQLAPDATDDAGNVVTVFAADPSTGDAVRLKGVASKIFWKAN